MDQIDLQLKMEMTPIDASVIARMGTLTQAVMLCQQLAGLDDKELCKALGIDAGQWSRIKTGQAHFPQERLCKLMDVCGNEAPLLWLAFHRGYELRPRLTEVEKQLVIERREKQRVEDENKLLRSMLIGRAA